MEKLLNKKEFIEASGVPRQTIDRWLSKDKLVPSEYDADGKPLFAEKKIDEARAMHRLKKYHQPAADGVTVPEMKLEKIEDTLVAEGTYTLANLDVAGDTSRDEIADVPAAEVKDDEIAVENSPESATQSPQNAPIDGEGTKDTTDAKTAEIEEQNNSDADAHATQVEENPNPAAPVPDEAPAVEVMTLDQRAKKIRQLAVDVQKGIIEIGFELIAAKAQVGHGNWSEWLQKEFEWNIRTAQNFMAIAERFGNTKTFSHLPKSKLIKMLALPDGDEEKFIAAQAEAGRPIESQSAREVGRNVEEWKEQHSKEKPEEISLFPEEVGGGKYFNATGAEKNNAVVDEFNATEPRESVSAGSGDTSTAADSSFLSREVPTAEDVQSPAKEKKLPPIAHNRNGSVEWYTPADVIKAAREVLGVIDLDPASSESANKIVGATKFFSAEDNGLIQEWLGRVWLNPPFANGVIDQFVDKFLAEWKAGHVTAAIILTDNATETRWYRKLIDAQPAIVFTTGRINFYKGGTFEEGSPTRGQSFFYYGSDADKFYRVFAEFGWCCKVIAPDVPLEKEKSLFD